VKKNPVHDHPLLQSCQQQAIRDSLRSQHSYTRGKTPIDPDEPKPRITQTVKKRTVRSGFGNQKTTVIRALAHLRESVALPLK
jgi:hypothetical protein